MDNDLIEQQIRLEDEYNISAMADYQTEIQSRNTLLNPLIRTTAQNFADIIDEFIQQDEAPRVNGHVCKWIRDLNTPTINLSVVILKTLLSNRCNPHEKIITIAGISSQIYNAVYLEHVYHQAVSVVNLDKGSTDLRKWADNFHEYFHKRFWSKSKAQLVKNMSKNNPLIFSDHIENRIAVGALLLRLSCLIRVPIVKDGLAPMFEIKKHWKRGRVYNILEWSDELKMYQSNFDQWQLSIQATHQPMICPPKPWTSMYSGAYYTARSQYDFPLIRNKLRRIYNNVVVKPTPIKIINSIQSVHFKINEDILEVMTWAKESDNDLGDFFVAIGNLELKERIPNEVFVTLTQEEKDNYTEHNRTAHQNFETNLTERLLSLRIYNLASKYHKLKKGCYLPTSSDFRGRLYYASELSPQGNDPSKALLTFHNKQPLGKSGFKWLCIHGANAYGMDKLTFDDRLEWVKDNHTMILSIAFDPYSNRDDWTEVDKPWQFLAFCFEYSKINDYDGSINDYESDFIVTQDASANGLQHYAGLLRDKELAIATNIIDSGKRVDIYQLVCNKVIKRINSLAKKTNNKTNKQIYRQFARHMTRKIVKKATMSYAYGITKFAICDGILCHINEGDFGTISSNWSKKETYKFAFWLSKVIFSTVESIAQSGQQIMEWLKECVDIISVCDDNDKVINIDSQIGFNFANYYFITKAKLIKTSVGKKVITTSVALNTDQLNYKRIKQSISANYIHYLDSTHLGLTVLNFGGKDITVCHDSFGCHAGDMDSMRDVIKEQFIELHKSNPLQKFSEKLKSDYPTCTFPDLPTAGLLKLDEVTNSQYMIS